MNRNEHLHAEKQYDINKNGSGDPNYGRLNRKIILQTGHLADMMGIEEIREIQRLTRDELNRVAERA